MNKYSDLQIRKSASQKANSEVFITKIGSNEVSTLTPKGVVTHSLPKDLRISQFSHLENFRAEAVTNRILYTPQNLNSARVLEKQKFPDFQQILQKLNQISTRPDFDELKEISEHRIESSLIKENEFLHYKVKCKDKNIPLRVESRTKGGKIRWFLSKTITKPNESTCEFTYLEDIFEVSEGNSVFLHNWYFISIQGLSACEFSFLLKFGKRSKKDIFDKPLLKRELSLNNPSNYDQEFREKLNKRVEQLLKDRKQKAIQLASCKDFVKLNKVSSGFIIFKEIDSWQERKEQAWQKKHQIAQEKMQKAKDYINRKLLRLEKIEQDAQQEKKNRALKIQRRLWARLFFFIKNSETLHKIIKNKRTERLNQLKTNHYIRLIQKAIRSYLHFMKRKHISFLACRNNLTLMHITLFKAGKIFISRSIPSVIKESYLNFRIPKVFDAFNMKIIKIQRQVRRFLKVTKERIRSLLITWNSVLSKMIKENSQKRVNPYTRISVDHRDAIIRKYYNECSERFLRKIKICLEAFSMRKRKSKVDALDAEITLPGFEYQPSEETIRKLINSALKSLSIKNYN